MAGQTDNTDILAGLNQTIQAINDLLLSSTCTPQVSVTCGETGGGVQGPSNGGSQGGAAPAGWSDPPDPPTEPEFFTRKCKIANAIHGSLVDWLTLWQAYNVDGYSVLMTISLISVIGFLIGEVATPVPLLDGVAGLVIGFLSAAAIAIISGGFNLTNILSLMSTYEDDLVCALYSASSTQDGIDDYIQVLDDNGASTGDLLLLQAVVVIDLLNNLFFKKGDAIDNALAGYTGPVDCTLCPCADHFVWGSGNLNGGLISSELSTYHRIQFRLSAQTDVTLSSLTGWSDSPLTNFRASSETCIPPISWDLRNSNSNPFVPDWDMSVLGNLVVVSSTAFTFVLTRN